MPEDSILNLNYDSPQEIKQLLEIMGLGPRKRWGQNFLINSGARKRIVDLLDIEKGNVVWEVGPGLGSITKLILEKDVKLKAFEIDPGYVEYLKKAFEEYPKFSIVQGDVLKTWKGNRRKVPNRFIGNLPYNVSTSIITTFIENDFVPDRMIYTVQREMGQRMTAKPRNKNYSSFSVLCQAACVVKEVGVLRPGSFYPVPGVSSAIITMDIRPEFRELEDKETFFTLIRQIFTSRRKTIKNNIGISPFFQKFNREDVYNVFEDCGVSITSRAETVTVEQYVEISKKLSALLK